MLDIYKFISLGIFGIQLFMGWFLWSLRKEFVSQSDCNRMKMQSSEYIASLRTRTHRTEDAIQILLPLVGTAQKLSLQIEKLSGDIRSITAILERVENKVNKQEEFLLRNIK